MLAGFRLVLRRPADGRLVLTVPVSYKLLLAAIGAVIVTFLVVVPPEGQRSIFVSQNTLPLIVSGLAFLGAAYHERWVFDKAGDAVIHQWGLFFLHRDRRLAISQLQGLAVGQFVKGRLERTATETAAPSPTRRSLFYTPVLTMSLRTKDGTLHRLESYGASHRPRLEAAAEAIARYCELPVLRD